MEFKFTCLFLNWQLANRSNKRVNWTNTPSSTKFALKLIDYKFTVISLSKVNKLRHQSAIVVERLERLSIWIHHMDMSSAT